MEERSLYFQANWVFMGTHRPFHYIVVLSKLNEPPRKAQTPSASSTLYKRILLEAIPGYLFRSTK